MAVITVDIVSDTICPWCFIGYKDLQKAINLYKKTIPGGSKDEIDINWKPFFLDQEAPKESIRMGDRMLKRMTPQQVAAAQQRLRRVGQAAGIRLSFDGYIGSSRLSHQLIYVARMKKGSAMQSRVTETIFEYQFERGADLSRLGTVLEVAVEAGLDKDEVQGWFEDGLGLLEVEKEAQEQRENGIQSVPHFIIGQHHVDGAVDIGAFLEMLGEAKQDKKQE
ncbi:hypothetical protein ASPZODRAFT_55801 [Penicilliopsis zonata CBS 506.65]|uniref:DSBA-like thioredoxin domain-containing protein n=1 Tax=Penicilliopsis zonata CBS 506.65 TaxID=1073090 RepID=A0A1L9SWJ5_9EURO|nr:hypothetical protein ASPZODRAFT_55801 [Penicilliopsis zonata CBS 506.65]OJJ51481.1 hypothetical protein ASPZODRAFT_55801 [Penicilliopsis zonata CBS 506.65]